MRKIFILVLAFFCWFEENGLAQKIGEDQTGSASFYANRFQHRKTASGERFNNKVFTAAHRKLPFGTLVEVTNLTNNKTVVVRINDRGPFTRRRIIDLSRSAAKQLGFIAKGHTKVCLRILGKNSKATLDSCNFVVAQQPEACEDAKTKE